MQRFPTLAFAAAMLAASVAMAQAPGFDGVYLAPQGGASGNSRCGTTKFGYALRVTGGIASVQTVTKGELQGPVQPDGSLTIQAGDAGFAGKITGKHFSGTYTVRQCQFALEYDKR